MKRMFLVISLGLAMGFGSACQRSEKIEAARPETSAQPTSAPAAIAAPAAAEQKPISKSTNEVAVIKTIAGEMVVEFWPDVAPNTVENFKKLARQGFYDGTASHRLIKGFMIQMGDPFTKDPSQEAMWGQGDPGYKIKAEFNPRKHERGVLSMARGPDDFDSAGCQFFICFVPRPDLDNKYTTFGKVIKGEEVLAKLEQIPVKPNPFDPRRELSRPIDRVSVESIKIVPGDSVK